MVQHKLVEKSDLTGFAAYITVFFPAKLNCSIDNFKRGEFSAILGKEGKSASSDLFNESIK